MANRFLLPFSPVKVGKLSVTTTASDAANKRTLVTRVGSGRQIALHIPSDATAPAVVAFGASGVVATTLSADLDGAIIVPPGDFFAITIPENAVAMGCVSLGSAVTLYWVEGYGN